MTAADIKDIAAEAGVIASVLLKPELTFYSEQLRPNHFTNPENAYVYWAVSELAKHGVTKVDAYNILNILNNKSNAPIEGIGRLDEQITIPKLNDLIEVAGNIARSTPEDYMVVVASVADAAFRRHTYNKLSECQRLCFNSSEEDIEQKIYSTLDDVMMEFSSATDIPQYSDIVESMWNQIEERQGNGMSGIPFKFNTLNSYVNIEPGELVIFAAEAKKGKSMILLNCAVDLLRQGKKVFYIDSELNTRLFTCRIVSHITGIDFNRVKAGRYDIAERERITEAIRWLKQKSFTHLYTPMFDPQTIYAATKKIKHKYGLDVLIIDYFKSSGDGDAFSSYQELGRLTDLVKNRICGDMNIAGIGAAQATSSGKVADSAKIVRNASTIVLIQDKTPEEVQMDGSECGNKKLRVVFNRNGPQMTDNEYIDMFFDGNVISYEEAKQHIPVDPY